MKRQIFVVFLVVGFAIGFCSVEVYAQGASEGRGNGPPVIDRDNGEERGRERERVNRERDRGPGDNRDEGSHRLDSRLSNSGLLGGRGGPISAPSRPSSENSPSNEGSRSSSGTSSSRSITQPPAVSSASPSGGPSEPSGFHGTGEGPSRRVTGASHGSWTSYTESNAVRNSGPVVKVPDEEITWSIRNRMLFDRAIGAQLISVKTLGGVVTLYGSVKENAVRARAQEIAENVSGVRSVLNKIQVPPA